MTTFNPPVAPSVNGTTGTETPRVRRAEFGDGYSQRTKDGLNFVRRTMTLNWATLSIEDRDTIKDFFRDVGGADAFEYTLPTESTVYKWTNGPVRDVYVDGLLVGISVDITQEFDL